MDIKKHGKLSIRKTINHFVQNEAWAWIQKKSDISTEEKYIFDLIVFIIQNSISRSFTSES
jgi:hypothetical protein